MPTNRRRRRAMRRSNPIELTEVQAAELETGQPFIRPRGGPVTCNSVWAGFRGNREDLEAAWAYHGKRILAEYVAKFPGRRPFCWWLFEHRNERPVIDPSIRPEELDCLRRERYGFLHTRMGFQEDETTYLRRHGLLAAAEEKALAERAT